MADTIVARRARAVVCAGSAGGFPVLLRILRRLPSGFVPPIVIVLHVNRYEPSALAEVLARATGRAVKRAEDREQLRPRVVYVAPPDHHIELRPGGFIALTQAPPEHYVRPAADRLFLTAARTLGRDVVGVVLSGSGRDGARGARAIHDAGGLILVEDPAAAAFSGMPTAAIDAGAADRVLGVDEIADELVRLVS